MNIRGHLEIGRTCLVLFLAGTLLLGACATGDIVLRSKNLIEVQGRPDEAIRLLESELQRRPSSAPLWYWLGIGRFKKADFGGAATALERSFDLNLYKTYRLTGYDYLGWARFYTGDYDKAIEAFNGSLSINPNYADSLFGRGRAALKKNDTDKAIEDLTRFLAFQRGNADALRDRGWAYLFKVRHAEALADFQESFRNIAPGDRFRLQDAYRGQGWTYRFMGQFEPAVEAFDKALSNTDPGNRMALLDGYHGRGWCHYYRGNFEGALRDFDSVLQYTGPEDRHYLKEAGRGKAFALAGLGRNREAVDSMNRAYEGAGEGAAAQDLMLLHYAMGDTGKAWFYRGGEGFVGAALQDSTGSPPVEIRIVDVTVDGPAARAGLRSGDILTALQGRPLSSSQEAARTITELEPGRSVTATVRRDGRQVALPVTVASAAPILEQDRTIEPLLKARQRVASREQRPGWAETGPSVRPPSFLERPARGISRAWAVVVGISRYRYATAEGLTNLAFADEDARAFAEALIALGWDDSHIRRLINEEATLRNIVIALESWLTKAGPDDLIVLFWSGHGFPDPEDPEKVYFACYDTDIRIPATGYRMDKVRQALEERRSRNVILLADTCHAGKLITRGGRGISIVPQIDKMRREQAVPKGWIFMVGADSDRQAIEHSSWTNGAFTHTLLKGLSGEADGYESIGPRDGVVTMGELRGFLNAVMPDETQRVLGAAKRPVITTSTGDPEIWNLSIQFP